MVNMVNRAILQKRTNQIICAIIMVFMSLGILVSTTSPVIAAFGFCSKPFPPSDYFSKPTKPYCAASRTCKDYEVQSYKYEVEAHYRKLKNYLDDIDRYRDDAYQYAKCMAALD